MATKQPVPRRRPRRNGRRQARAEDMVLCTKVKEPVYLWVESVADAEGVSISHIVREALRREYQRRKALT